jgi:hypothetical protein
MLARWEAEFGGDHPSTSEMRCKFARALMANGRNEEALKESRTAYECLRTMLGPKHRLTMEAERVKDAAHYAAHGPTAGSLLRLRAMTRT